MSKIKTKIDSFHWTHFAAAVILVGYFVTSKANMLYALSRESLFESYMQLFVFGIFFACLFLFIFSHEKFFPVAREIEKKERAKEEKYLNKYLHHGKVLATFLIGVVGGPVFSSLTARILLNKYPFKYIVIIMANIPSTFITVALAKGVIHFL